MPDFHDIEMCDCGTLKGEIDKVLAELQGHLSDPRANGCMSVFVARVMAYMAIATSLDGLLAIMSPISHADLQAVGSRLSSAFDDNNLEWLAAQVQTILEADRARKQGAVQ